METEVIFDYSALVATLDNEKIIISHASNTLYTLSPELTEGAAVALVRVGERLSFYRVTQCGGYAANNIGEMLIAVISQINGGLFYVTGQCNIKTRRIKGKACRSVSIGTSQVAFRDQSLIFNSITTRSLGTVVLDDTGDTLPLYAQLNALI